MRRRHDIALDRLVPLDVHFTAFQEFAHASYRYRGAMRVLQILRQLFRHRQYSVAYVGTLALAVAAATVSLAVVKRAFFDALPYPDGGRLVALLTEHEGNRTAVSPHVLAELAADASPLTSFVPIRPEGAMYTFEGGADQLMGVRVTPAFFVELGAVPILGRNLQEDDRDVVVVSSAFWQRALGSDSAAVGRSITLDGSPHTVVGVLHPDFLTPYFTQTEIFKPLDLAVLIADNPRARRNVSVVARIVPGVDQDRVDSYLRTFTVRQQQAYPEIHGKQSWIATPLREELIGESGTALAGVGAAAVLLTLIVIANLAGLSAARAIGLRHQLAIRVALGAARSRLIRESLAESLMLAVAGAAGGVWLGNLLLAVVRTYQKDFLLRMPTVGLDWKTALAGCLIGVACGVVTGIAAIAAGRDGFAGILRTARGDVGGKAQIRSGLVVAQVALALVLVAGAGLLVRTMANLSAVSLGFVAERLTLAQVLMPGAGYATRERQVQFERDVVAALERIPGVVDATASVGFPVWGGTGAGLFIAGRQIDAGVPEIMYLSIAPGFLQVTGVQLLAGRGIESADGPDAPRAVVINETMARTYWPGTDPIGAQVRIGPVDEGPWITVVGVIADVRQHGPVEPVRPTAFGSTWQYSWPRRHFAVRTVGTSPNLATDIRKAVASVDPGIAVSSIQPLEEMVANQTARHRLVAVTFSFFGVVAMVLCGLGLYGVVALTSRMRRREYAVRMALGAPFARVRWLVVRQALMLASLGMVVGLAITAGGTRMLVGLLHGVAPMDQLTLGATMLLVLGLAVLSAWWPARDAGRVAPAEVLRSE